MGEMWENFIAVLALGTLSVIYMFILASPSQQRISFQQRRFVIPSDSKADFELFLHGDTDNAINEANSISGRDDFFLDENQIYREKEGWGAGDNPMGPIEPAERYICTSGWLSFRSEATYKYLWTYGGQNKWLSAGATADTPLHLKSFEVIPVDGSCTNGGWVHIKSFGSDGYLRLNVPDNLSTGTDWVVEVDKQSFSDGDESYHFLLEEAGYVLNKKGMAFLNVIYDGDGEVRGHTSAWDKSKPAGREYGAVMTFHFLNESDIIESLEKSQVEDKIAAAQDKKELTIINSLPVSSEKRVISFGLYGSNSKYTVGAIRNAELAKIYFPGWICRYYVTNDVPGTVIETLKFHNAEIIPIPNGMGKTAGMFYRFLVAADNSVDRFIVRDVDSRLNARDRLAVEEWIESKLAIHIMRDHVNHCLPINGGMWGGVMGALPSIQDQIMEWHDKNQYMADLQFLESRVWPDVVHRHIAHDSYCCDQYPNTRPFPTQRPPTYLHVGQVFNENDMPRLSDIEGYIRGVPTPVSCRKDVEWIFG